MKKLIFALFCAACVFTVPVTAVATECTILQVEDVDMDGDITAVDALQVLNVATFV